MELYEYTNIAIAFFLAAVIGAIISVMVKRNQKILTPVNILIFGVFFASAILFYPLCAQQFSGEIPSAASTKTVLISLYYALQLFVVGGDFSLVQSFLAGKDPSFSALYSVSVALAYVIAPVITFSFILSLFKNAFSYIRYCTRFFRKIYIFSELNEKSIALAQSINETKRRPAFVFTDVFEKDDENSYELMEQAARLGAICFKKDIQTLRFGFHCPGRPIRFFAIGTDENENLKQALGLIRRYGKRHNTKLYAFSVLPDGEVLLSNPKCTQMKVRRISDVRSLIYSILYDSGEELFLKAKQQPCGTKTITAVIAGLGSHGSEMLKALTWLCQMDGYKIKIHAFEREAGAKSSFQAECPELLSGEHNGVHIEGDSEYEIHVHAGIDVESYEFVEAIKEITDATYAFVALGEDSKNIKTAIRLRTLFLENGIKPTIQAVVYDSEKQKALEDIQNAHNQKYEIAFVGDLKTLYSDAVILNSELEEKAKKRHLDYAKQKEEPVKNRRQRREKRKELEEAEKKFWGYEYNYRSSVASVIHKKMRIACRIPGAEKAVSERSEKEKTVLRKIEHKRWAAYIRSEGYSYSETRNDLAKKHNLLVPFDKLSPEDQQKNDD